MIDWLTISQVHEQGGLPLIFGGFFAKSTHEAEEFHFYRSHEEFEADCKEDFVSFSKKKVEASHSTSMMISCDGSRVSLSANVGRFGREDNLFNLDFWQTIEKANQEIAKYGLPPFTKATYHKKAVIDGHLVDLRDGAEISMVHVCRNYETGSPENAQAMINHFASLSVSHVRNGRSHATSYSWGKKGGRLYMKAYMKAPEMFKHFRQKQKIPAAVIEEIESYKYARDRGIVRIEVEIDRKTLLDTGLKFIENVSMEKLFSIYDKKVNQILNVPMINLEEFNYDELPRSLKSTALLYFHGENIRKHLSKSTFYRHAKKLRPFGVDISVPYYKQRKEEGFKPVINVIRLTECTKPDWYSFEKTEPEQQENTPLAVVQGANALDMDYFINGSQMPLIKPVPDLKIVGERMTVRESIEFLQSLNYDVSRVRFGWCATYLGEGFKVPIDLSEEEIVDFALKIQKTGEMRVI